MRKVLTAYKAHNMALEVAENSGSLFEALELIKLAALEGRFNMILDDEDWDSNLETDLSKLGYKCYVMEGFNLKVSW